jgi:hypothetical protein
MIGTKALGIQFGPNAVESGSFFIFVIQINKVDLFPGPWIWRDFNFRFFEIGATTQAQRCDDNDNLSWHAGSEFDSIFQKRKQWKTIRYLTFTTKYFTLNHPCISYFRFDESNSSLSCLRQAGFSR